MIVGPFIFGAPIALVGLVSLPVIWWLLRATPPRPAVEELPSLRLLDDVTEADTTPARTPWYILLLRLLAAALAIVGLSLPVWSPQARLLEGVPSDPFLIVIDDGWTSAARWPEMIDAAEAAMIDLPRDTAVHILTTAPRTLPIDPSVRLSRGDAEARLRSLDPVSWPADRSDALARLTASGLKPARTVWISDGLDGLGRAELVEALSGRSGLSVQVLQARSAYAISAVLSEPGGARIDALRFDADAATDFTVSARTLDLSPVASEEGAFPVGETLGRAEFRLPTAALNRIGVFTLSNVQGAGATWLWDASAKRQRVGLVSPGSLAQPLLEDVYYVRKALEPFAEVTEGEIDDLVASRPDAIVITDSGPLSEDSVAALTAWVERGGALIRFAGPGLAAQDSPELLPVPLRRAARSLGGALNWDTPQALAEFDADSPFAGLTPPANARVRQQVLAQPSADLNSRTWARLEDGSPIITAAPLGDGTLILFHISAGPDWSDLAFTGTFVELLRRAIAAGRGEPVADGADGNYAPLRVLDAYGRLTTPDAEARPLAGADFFAAPLSAAHPPGLYQGPAGIRARNTASGFVPIAAASWPGATVITENADTISRPLTGPLLLIALALVALDLFIALWVAGRFRQFRRRAATAAVLLICATGFSQLSPQTASAQQFVRDASASKFDEAVSELRFAYIITGDRATDEMTRAGLAGLSLTLNWRTSVEPAEAHGVDPETDALEAYPILFFVLPDAPQPLSARAVERINTFMASGGVLIIDTRQGGTGNPDGTNVLQGVMNGLDIRGLVPVPEDHVIRRTFYLTKGFPGRYQGGRVWIENPGRKSELGDSGEVSRVIIGSSDWMSAWAIDARGRPLRAVDGGETQREMSRRVGVNMVIYALTGTYKDDQVHLPDLLERLGRDDPALPNRINDGGATGGPQ